MIRLTAKTISTLLAAALLYACSGGSPAAPGGAGGVEPDGGAIGADGGAIGAVGGVTYTKDVAPILQDHCQTCHTTGGIGPFTLLSFGDAKAMVGPMVSATQSRAMPPWGAQNSAECAPPRPWLHDMRLTDAQIATLKAWKDNGAPEGDPKDAPPPRVPEALDLPGANFTTTPQPFALTTTTKDTFRCFVIDPKLAQTRYFNGASFTPGNKEIVHHVLLFSDAKGESAKLADASGGYDCFGGAGVSQPNLVAAWAPGAAPMELPPNAGVPLTAGTLLVMQIHYHPHGQDLSPDATKVQLRLSDTPPEYTAITSLIGNFKGPNGADGLLPGPNDNGKPQFKIPANVSGHTETMRMTIPQSAGPKLYVYGVAAHMHLIGNAEKVWVDHAAGGSECMLQVPAWNFNWQRMYSYDAPIEQLPTVVPGDKLTVQCTYDNTTGNPFMAQALADQGLSAPHDVSLGETTLDEMCLAATIFLQKTK